MGDIFQVRFSQSDRKTWWKCSQSDLTRVWETLTCWLSTGVLKRCFLESGLMKSFTVCNFRNKVATTIILFFSKCLKFDAYSRNGLKKFEKVFGFRDHCNWFGDDNFSKSRKGYLSLAVNVLRNTPKIFHITKGDIFQVSFCQSDEKIWWKFSHADFTRIWDPLTCWLAKGFLKQSLF